MKTQLTSFSGAVLAAAFMTMGAPLTAGPFTTNTGAAPAQQQQAQPPVYGAPTYVAAHPNVPQQSRSYAYQQQRPVYSAPQYGQPKYAQPRVAYQMPSPAGQLPTPGETVPAASPAPAYNAAPAHSYSAPATHAQPPVTSSYPTTTTGTTGSNCNCNTGAPAASWEGYAAAPVAGDCGGGCATGDCGGSYDCGSGYSATTCYDAGPQRQWFAGVYGLFMQRDRPGTANIAVVVDGATGTYYPQPTDLFLISSQADTNFAAGAEVRFGSTFGYSCNPCGCGSYQPFAWEVGYWALEEDSSMAVTSDTFGGTTRMYGMMNYAGLEYDRDGAGGTYAYRPVNDYYDYQMPIDTTSTNNVRVLANRVRQNFKAQNIEINFWRFGAPAASGGGCATGGCGTSSCGSMASACGGGYDACGSGCGGYDACASSCGVATTSCAPAQRFFISGLAGVRFVQFDEFFQNAVFFTLDDGSGGVVAGEPGSYPNGMPTNDDNVLFHDIEVDNDLVGFQLGCSMNCLVGCKWTLFADTNFGIYGNDADVYQRVYSGGGGNVRFVGTGGNAAVRTSKQDVAFLGEARLGVGYQISCKWRATAAWRVMGVSGVALASEQIPQAGFPNAASVGQIDTNDSLILHGLQAGIECKY